MSREISAEVHRYMTDICNDRVEVSKEHVIDLLSQYYPEERMLKNARLLHIQILKKKLCTKVCKFTAHTEDVVKDIEYLGNDRYTYKGIEIPLEIKNLGVDGTFGYLHVATFVDDASKSFIIKKTKKERLEEVDVINNYLPAANCDGVVKMKKITGKGSEKDFVIMPKADGDLFTLVSSHLLNKHQINKIISVVKKALDCLLENGTYYFDVKPANILYQCQNNTLEIFLGDMGSILPIRKKYIATYPPPDHIDGLIPDNITKEKTLDIYEYQIAVLYCVLTTGITGKRGPVFTRDKRSYLDKVKHLALETERVIGKNKYSDLLQTI